MPTLAPSWIVRAGCTPALSVTRLLDFVRALQAREPAVDVQVSHQVTFDQLERLLLGDLDLAIVIDPDEHPELEFEPLFAGEALAACISADHRLAERGALTPEDLETETLVTWPRSANPPAYDRAMARFEAAGYRFAQVEETESAAFRDLAFAAASGRGISVVPASREDLAEAGLDVVVRPLDPVVRLPSNFLAWRSSASPGLLPILDTLRAVARELFESAEVETSPRHAPELTARQLDVLRLLAEGKTTSEIAQELHLSQTTVRNHVAALIAALGVHTRLQAVLAGRRRGLLDL